MTPYERVSPQLQERLCYTATQTGSYQKAALLASCWGTAISDDLVHSQVQSIGLQVHQQVMPAPTGAPKNEAPFSLVIMLDGWMVRERGPQWAAPPDCQDAERVAWHEVKSGVIYRLDHRAETASDRGVLTQKKVVACPPGTDVLEFGATVQKEALRCGMARAQEVFVFVVVDGAVWLWSLIEYCFSGTTQTLDFYHASQRLWELAHYLYANDAEAARVFVEPLLYTSCVTEKVRASSRASKKYSQRHLFKMTRRTMTQPTLSSNVRSNTSSITVIIFITKLWLSVALRSDPVQWSHNAASSKIVSSAPASSGLAAWPAQPPGSPRYDPKQNFRLPLELEILTNRRCALCLGQILGYVPRHIQG